MKSYRATDKRSYRCPTCDAIVKAPRKYEIEQVRATHQATCAGLGRGAGR